MLRIDIIHFNTNREKIDFYAPPYTHLYFFLSKESKGKKPLTRAHFNRPINAILKNVSEFQEQGRMLTSQSFRHGSITEFWRQTGDMNVGRQIMGYATITSTLQYVENMVKIEARVNELE